MFYYLKQYNANVTDENGFSPISLERTSEYCVEVLPKNSADGDSCWRWGTKLSGENISVDTMQSNLVAKNVRTGGYNIYEKYRKETVKAKTIWLDTDFITEKGTMELGQLDLTQFEFPKPVALLERVLTLATAPGDIVLDSFAGSGTTAHAVLNMNKRDGGTRRFILVETEDYAESITAERVRRVIDGYADKPGTGGGFAYCELGERLLLEDGNLNENLDAEKIREYVWYTETRSEYAPQEESYLLGVMANTAYYFYYEKGRVTVLDHDFLHGVKTRAGGYLIYADINTLSAEEMDAANIRFKKIPRDITRL